MDFGLVGAGHYNIPILIKLFVLTDSAFQRIYTHRQEVSLFDYNILAVDQLSLSLFEQVNTDHSSHSVRVLLLPVLLCDS